MDEFDNMIRGRRGEVPNYLDENKITPALAIIALGVMLVLFVGLVTATVVLTGRLLGVGL